MWSGWWPTAGFLAGGTVVGALGAGVFAVGTGSFGVETETFVHVQCTSAQVRKGGTVWHCKGESREQARINDEARRREPPIEVQVLRDEVVPYRPRQRTPLLFVDHDGRRDPEQVTASRFPGTDRWIAHAGGVIGTGVSLSLLGCGSLAYGGYRLRKPR